MWPIKIICAVLLLSVLHNSCIKQVDVATRNEKPILVLEGSITTDSVPYTVRLSYSGPIKSSENIPDQYLEKDARVSISDDAGNTTELAYTQDGIYQTTDPQYIGTVGRSYSVTAIMKDGKKYISAPEKIKPAVPVTKINIDFINDFDMFFPTYMNVSVDADDPAQEENFYRWTFESYTMRQTKGVGCGFGCVMFEYCYQFHKDREVRLLSDAAINGNQVKKQLVGRCYIYTYGNPYISIEQISLTREAYQFWKSYQDQLTRTGGILDPLPAAIKGNVYNEANTADFALGYFSASGVYRKRAILVPFSITQYQLDISARQFIPDQSIACFDFVPDALVYPPPPARQYPPPPGWENAEAINVYW